MPFQIHMAVAGRKRWEDVRRCGMGLVIGPIATYFSDGNLLQDVARVVHARDAKKQSLALCQVRCQVVSVPASAFPLTLLALMGFRDPIDGQLQVQTEEVQWGVRKLR